ncbi:MAG: tetratricopeptide repeat protein [Acidobacteriia bacterium]|nr:tetratricopeptide repeat protein [Terriglobia bacterium]
MGNNMSLAYLRGAAVLSLALMLGACRSANDYVKKGDDFAAQGKYADAELNYRKALQKNPNFGEAYYQLALTDLKQGKVVDGYRTLVRAQQLMPSRDDIKVKLADLSLSIFLADRNRPQVPWNEAVRLANELLAKNPKSFDGLRLKGHLAVASRNLKDAEEFYRRANSIKPMDPEVTLGLTQVLFQLERPKEAEDLAMALIAHNKSYGPIYDLLIQRRLAAKDLGGAEQLLKAKHASNPTNAGDTLELARFYAGTSRDAEMKAVLQEMTQNPKVFPQAPLQVGDFYAVLRRWDEARKQYEAGAQATSGKNDPAQHLVYLKRVADVWLVQGKGEEANRVIDDILKAKPDDEGAAAVKGSLLIASRTPENVNKAIALLQPLAAKDGNNATLHYTFGRALAAKGDLDTAQKELQIAVQKNQRFIEPRLALAEMGQLKGDYRTTLRYTNEILAINPNLPRVRILHAVSLLNTGDTGGGRKELTALEKAYPQDKELQLQFAVMELREKHFKEAEEYFRKLSAGGPEDVRALSGLTQTLAAEGQLEKAVALLAEEVKKAPGNNQLRYLYGVTAAMAGKYDAAAEEFQRVANTNPKSAQIYMALGNVYRAKGDYGHALSTLQKSAELAPKDPGPLVAEAEVLSASGHTADALDKYRAALRMAPDNPTLLNNVAYLLADTGGSLDEALKYARRALQLDSKQARYSDTLGWIYFKQNLNESALEVFRGLTASNPDNPTFHYHLAMVLLQKGDKATAKTELKNALSKKPPADVRHSVEAELSKLG